MPPQADQDRPGPRATLASLSYTSLAAYKRCPYRFYVERLLGVPPTEVRDASGERPSGAGSVLSPTERGTVVHALLERLDFRRPVVPAADVVATAVDGLEPTPEESEEIATLIAGFLQTETFTRLAAAAGSMRLEERFAFMLGGVLINGVLDAVTREPGERLLIVDYKSDRLEGRAPGELMSGAYEVQRLIYALAGLRAGAAVVEVRHLFLDRPHEPVTAVFVAADDDAVRLERELTALAQGVLARDFRVTDTPHRSLCSGCPGEDGLCSWPTEMTRREAPDRLF
jgi:ATP-dependent exoDNAse (exonuclease V) beta subunit